MNTQPEKDPITELIKKNLPGVITSDEFLSFHAACFLNLISVFALFTWNYLDIFIMVVAHGLSTHFKLINDKLEQAIRFAEPDSVYPHISSIHPILKVNHQLIVVRKLFKGNSFFFISEPLS